MNSFEVIKIAFVNYFSSDNGYKSKCNKDYVVFKYEGYGVILRARGRQ